MNIFEASDIRDLLLKYADGEKDLTKVDFTPEQKKEINKMTLSFVNNGAKARLIGDMPFAGFFGSRSRSFISYELPAPAGVNVTSSGISVHMNLFINPLYLIFEQGQTDKPFIQNFDQMAALLLHEYEHLLFDHQNIFRYWNEKGYSEVTNIAADGVINQDPYIVAQPQLTQYGITLDALRKLTKNPNLPAKLSSMDYFNELMKARKSLNKNPLQGQQGQSNQNGQGQSNQNGQGQSDQNGQGQSNQNGQGQSDQNGQGQSGQNDQGQSDQNGQGQSGQNGQGQSNQNGQGQSDQNGQGQSDQNGQGQSGQNGQGQSGQKKEKTIGKNEHAIHTNPMNPAQSHAVWDHTPSDVKLPDETMAGEAETTSAISQAVKGAAGDTGTSVSDLKSRGLIGGSIADALLSGQVTKGKLPIKSVLQKGAGRLKAGSKNTYARINHRQGNRIDLRKGTRTINNKNIHVFCDNSGSMSDDEIGWAVREIAAVAKQIKANLTITPFDAEIYPEKTQTISKTGKFQFAPYGRGGTAFQPVFDYLHDETNANNQNDMIIILSDGYGEDQVNTYGLRNIVWILVEEDSNTLSVENPIGQVAWLDNDNKYKLHKMGLN